MNAGFGWNVAYKRGSQHIRVPIHVTDELPSPGWLVALFFAPVVLDLLAQHVLLRPYYNRQRAKRQKEILAAVDKAKQEQRFMQREAEDRRRRERDNKVSLGVVSQQWSALASRMRVLLQGIVILQARYGLNVDKPNPQPSKAGELVLPSWIAVHNVLQTRVHHEGEYSRLVLFGDLARLPGFTDMAPNQPKVLDICYLYNNTFHRATIEEDDDEHIVLPNMAHRQAVDWKDITFDWPLDSEVTAEGSAAYRGVD